MKNLNHLVSLLQEGYVTIAVVFGQVQPQDLRGSVKGDEAPPWNQTQYAAPQPATQQQYIYKCHFECEVGDLVVVPPSKINALPSIATVVRVDNEPELNFEGDVEYKWAVCKVDVRGFEEVQNRERELIKMLRDNERAVQRKALLESYQVSLPSDPEGRKIFDAARQIGPTIKD